MIAALPLHALMPIIRAQPHPLLFVTISGAHLYGFPSTDSDFDLRGVHVLPLTDVIGLHEPASTLSAELDRDGLEVDLVTHDAHKFFSLLLTRNGYVLEQLLSPLVLHATPAFHELRALAAACITRHHAHHYLGFARTQRKLFNDDRRIKPLLYVYRVLLTGVHLMRTGQIQADLNRLNEEYRLPYLPDLIAEKRSGRERAPLKSADFDFHDREHDRLTRELETARDQSTLPQEPAARAALHDLLVRIRLDPPKPPTAT